MTARDLLSEADRFLAADERRLPCVEGPPWDCFRSGGDWMRHTLMELRSRPPAAAEVDFTKLGFMKYGLALGPALLVLLLAAATKTICLLLAAPIVFYTIESSMVFLFPVAIDGSRSPIRDSRRLARKAGSPWKVTTTVMGLAAFMLLGGLRDGRFLRCWTLGCLCVLLWYEKVRTAG